MSERIPDTEEVRHAYATRMAPVRDTERYAEFDRWLAAHDRETAARAWDEGAEAGRLNTYEHRPGRRIANPYREGDPT